MDLRFTPEENRFRDEVRPFFQTEIPKSIRDKIAVGEHLTKADMVKSHSTLAKKGWAAPLWPKEWGGTGWDPIQHAHLQRRTAVQLRAAAVAVQRHHVRPGDHRVRHRGAEEALPAADVRPARSGGARASRSRAPAPISPA